MDELLQTLRDRKLVQWGLAYAAGAFALLQGLDIVAQQFGWSDGVRRAITIALIIGLFVTLVLAWYHGERGAQRVSGTELLILTLLLAFGGVVLWRVAQSPREPGSGSVATHQAPAQGGARRIENGSDPVSEKSIAVLPFENLSDEKSNAYFAEGIQDEILTRLAKIGALKVISRTSTQQYAAKPANLPEAAHQLGVANVLEGSVQKSGDAVHVNVQLIRAATDEHLWAESYNRKLDDVFRVEADVAQAVAEALNAKLLPEEHARTAQAPTENAEAHELYLRARTHFNRANDQYNYAAIEEPEAIALYTKALEKDPNYALAAAELAWAQMYMYWFGPDRTDARLAAARAAADRALALQPDLGEARYALALYEYWGHRDYPAALRQVDLARKAWPNSAEVELIAAAIVRRQGDFPRALEGFQRATEFDPRNTGAFFDVALCYSHMRRYAEADRVFAHVAELTPEPALTQLFRAENIVFWRGDLEPMRLATAAITTKAALRASNRLAFEAAWWRRDFAAAAAIADAEKEQRWFDPSNVALEPPLLAASAYARAGDEARAKAGYEKMTPVIEDALRERPDDVDLHLALGFARAGLGRADEAASEARKAMSLMPESRDAVSGPAVEGYAARIFARIGANKDAIELAAHLMTIPCGRTMSVALLKLDPDWDPLRKDAQFEALLKAREKDSVAADQ